jgi:cytochrome c oxidase subunit 1
VSFLLFAYNVLVSRRRARKLQGVGTGHLTMAADPWDGRSLEWMLPSPTPAHNFDEIPVVRTLDEFWHRKYGEDENGRLVRVAATEDVVQAGTNTNVHLPSPSYWPIVLAFGLPFIGYGLIYSLWFALLGGICVVGGIYGWVMEPSVDPDTGHHDHEPGSTEPEPSGEAAAADEEAALVD